ncbi:hypothetical protein BB558_002724 [Smittium angustum]|uniref:Succinylglutamate desuccinylase/Aspartoacylase catalytic domain-containing protein n=1 Tax=Smittium angustum TaxID=133377 RepID=A0A2U1J894_SMIAN|nr:hypothetical protein BB558_002724 [Smittium angustum]
MVKIVSILSSALFATLANAATVYTGDILAGHKVITDLDPSDFPSNSVTKLWLRMPKTITGQPRHVPVIIAKGNSPGNSLMLNSGLHGDELNGIRVVQRVFKDIDTSKLKGTVVGVSGANVDGMENKIREYTNKYDSGILTDLNRQFPGNITNRSAAQKYAATLWASIYNKNYTAGVDFHTDTTGDALPNYVYADLTIPYVYRMTELTGASVIKIDLGSGTLGALENIWDRFGTPAITYELGSANVWQKDQIQRGYDYVFRQLADLEMYPPTTDTTKIATYEAQRKVMYYGTEEKYGASPTGGFTEYYAKLLDKVVVNQTLATLFNVFGDKVMDFKSEIDGVVDAIGLSPLTQPGTYIFSVIHNSTDPACANGC